MSRTAGDGALLRRELRRVWRLLETAMDAWGGQAAVFVGEIRRLAEEAAALRGRRDRLEAEVRDLKRRLAVHENYNNPDRGTVTARERKRHRRKLMEREAEEAEEEGTAGDAAECGGVRGDRPQEARRPARIGGRLVYPKARQGPGGVACARGVRRLRPDGHRAPGAGVEDHV